MRRISGALAALALLAGPAAAEPDPAALAEAAARVLADPRAAADFAACPGDIWQRRVGWLAPLAARTRFDDAADCAADLPACTDDCLTRQRGEACVSLAQTLEAAEDRIPARSAYALACALGAAAGCTNRGGGIRNVPLPDDPQSQRPDAERFTCLARTFRAGCDGGDSWGCTMFGQAHEFGEGVPADAGQARLYYQVACELADDPAFDACVWAGYGLNRLDE